MANHARALTILATLMLAGCGGMPNLSAVPERNDFVGKPLSAVTARLGFPEGQETVNGQKVYSWRRGVAAQQCTISVVMKGDIVEAYSASGDAAICGPYEARNKPSNN